MAMPPPSADTTPPHPPSVISTASKTPPHPPPMTLSDGSKYQQSPRVNPPSCDGLSVSSSTRCGSPRSTRCGSPRSRKVSDRFDSGDELKYVNTPSRTSSVYSFWNQRHPHGRTQSPGSSSPGGSQERKLRMDHALCQ